MWESTNRSHIELLIEQKKWKEAKIALDAYVRKNGLDYWAKNMLALVESNLRDR